MNRTTRQLGLAWAMLGFGLLATCFACFHVKQGIDEETTKQFSFSCDQITLKIRERLSAYALTLRGGVALFNASDEVDRHEWQAYTETLRAQESVPGVEGIGFAQAIAPSQLPDHIARIRREGFPEYNVRPAGDRPFYSAIVYLEPFRPQLARVWLRHVFRTKQASRHGAGARYRRCGVVRQGQASSRNWP